MSIYRKYKIWKSFEFVELSKEDLEKCILLDGFIEDLKSLTIKLSNKYLDSVFYMKDDTVWICQISKNMNIWCRYDDVWSFFESDFGYNYQEVREILKTILEEHLKLEGYTPFVEHVVNTQLLEEHLKLEGYTPNSHRTYNSVALEEHLKIKGYTPIYQRM